MSLRTEDLFSVAGKTAMVTGASGFLGRTFARTLLENGARVIAVGRSERLEKEVGGWAKEFGADRVRGLRVDMYDQIAFATALDRLVAEEPAIDVLVNNAHELGPATGFNVPDGGLDGMSIEQWMRNLEGGVIWPALTVQKVGQEMKNQGRGSIINVSTMYALVAPSPKLYEGTMFMNPPGYSASKAALLAFTRYTASFWGRYGVRANAIVPGPFSNTEDTDGKNSVKAEDLFMGRLRDRTCLGRIGQPSELAGALLYLASDASSFMTGQTLVVDGGWTTT